ncbi:hypothetical protein UA45_21120, partial [Morganella morganii]
KLHALVDDALKDIQKEIDLQALIDDSVAEFQAIHQEMLRQQARDRERIQAKTRTQRIEQHPKDPRLRHDGSNTSTPEPEQKPDRGWSFSR